MVVFKVGAACRCECHNHMIRGCRQHRLLCNVPVLAATCARSPYRYEELELLVVSKSLVPSALVPETREATVALL